MLKRLLKNRAGTAEIVGAVLFLVILFFFFSNVFLWHNQVTREMDQIVADKTNSAVRIETTVITGARAYGGSYVVSERMVLENYQLQAEYPPLDTRLDTSEKRRLVSAVHLSVRARYEDVAGEVCYIYAYFYDSDGTQHPIDTGLRVVNGLTWLKVALSPGSEYINRAGFVRIEFRDSSSVNGAPDVERVGQLSIDYMEVLVDLVALEVTNLGGLDAPVSRLWIVNSAQTSNPEKDHIYANLEPLLIPAGSQRDIMFNMTISETEFNPDGSVKVLLNAQGAVVNYVPASEHTLIFRVLTKLGNTAACSHEFPPD